MQTLSMKNWRIVDVDYYMKGNTFFKKMVTDVEWQKSLEARVGTKDERTATVKAPEDMEKVKEMLDMYETYINIKEPRSNRGMEKFKSEEDIEREKLEAQAKAAIKVKEIEAQRKAKAEAEEGGDKKDKKQKGKQSKAEESAE